MDYILPFSEISLQDISQFGGKNASLGEMTQHLSKSGVHVPEGFATTAAAYQEFLAANHLDEIIYSMLDKLKIHQLSSLRKTAQTIQRMVLKAALPPSFQSEIKKTYQHLNPQGKYSFAVRSSATAEDLPEASFAGQQETFLNVRGIHSVLSAVKGVYASLFSARAIVYRVNNGFDHRKVAISAGIQRMVRSDKAASGVVFTLDTESGFDKVIFITASYGLGELIVQGGVNPDEFYVYKPMLEEGKPAIISRRLGVKAEKMIYAPKSRKNIKRMKVDLSERLIFCLEDKEILELAKYASNIEKHYEKPMDIEWAKDGVDGKIYIVQARPETVRSRRSHQFVENYVLEKKGPLKITGRSVGSQIVSGKARVITHLKQMQKIREGEILIADMTDPDWEPIMKKVAGVVTNRGGRTCHAAIVARELGVPAVIGCGNATRIIKNNETITLSCAEGETGYVYRGKLPFHVERTEIKKMPVLPVKITLNLANPDQAFQYQFLPNDGVGLARLEFIINDLIGIHPQALLQFNKLPGPLKKQIQPKISAYPSPIEFYIAKLAEGIATIAAAFYPKMVIVRFSDFKSNEYANLLGGHLFEPREENPMIGFRGGSRYLSKDFRECFELECRAIRRVREELGLVNTQIMFPFVRTVDEAKQLINLLQNNGLRRGENDLQVFMMCEIPSNVLLADDFLPLFDGYSIGSNDLTQLILGLDRDSALVSSIFDERNAAVKIMLKQAIEACRRHGKYIGICGQAPSDYPELAAWLMEQNITALSLNPDSVVRTWLSLSNRKGVNTKKPT